MKLTIRSVIRRLACMVARARERGERDRLSPGRKAIGWITAQTLSPSGSKDCLGCLSGAVGMRVANNARWINQNTDDLWNELYRRDRRYDVVVFFKAMDAACQAEADRLRSQGTRIIFDANVNYYEIWGEYDIEDTRPTQTQQQDAIAMTSGADHVVADSSYIAGIARRYSPRVTWIPDNVDVGLFRRPERPPSGRPVRIAWSGVAKKADHLLIIRDVLARLSGVELVLVSDEMPAVAASLRDVIPLRFVRYSDGAYARTLRGCDLIISPKRLSNAYEMGHTEYKITLGMAVGLPAVASPQSSYVEAISYAGGGIVAENSEQWLTALQNLVGNAGLRADLGERAARTVRERYTTAVTAASYLQVLRGLAR